MSINNQNKETPGTGTIKGTIKPHSKKELDLNIRIFTLADGIVTVDGIDPAETDGSSREVYLEFPGDITNGEHKFTKDGPIKAIAYWDEQFHGSPKYIGVKNGKGSVTIEFNREARTLEATISNVNLEKENDKTKFKLNVVIKARELFDQD